MPGAPPQGEQPELVGSMPFISSGNSTHPRTACGTAIYFENSVQLEVSDWRNAAHKGTSAQAAGGAAATTFVTYSLPDDATHFCEREDSTRPFKTRRSLVNSDADCMPATVRTPASADHVHSRASVQHDYTSFGGSSSITPADTTVALIDDLIAQPSDEHVQHDTSAEGNFISRS